MKHKTGKTPRGASFMLHNVGGLSLLTPLDAPALEWVRENIDAQTAIYYGGALAIESRYAGPIMDALKGAGLEVRS